MDGVDGVVGKEIDIDDDNEEEDGNDANDNDEDDDNAGEGEDVESCFSGSFWRRLERAKMKQGEKREDKLWTQGEQQLEGAQSEKGGKDMREGEKI